MNCYANSECGNGPDNQYFSHATKYTNSIQRVKIPENMDEVFSELDKILSEEEKKSIVNDPKVTSHNELRSWIEWDWGLFCDSKLNSYFVRRGLDVHPDGVAQIILTTYARKLLGLPTEISAEIAKARFEEALSIELDEIAMLGKNYHWNLPVEDWANKVTSQCRTIMKSNRKFQCLFYSKILHKYQVLDVEYDSKSSSISWVRIEPPTWVNIDN